MESVDHWGMLTTESLWERALVQLLPLFGRMLSIEISATDDWVVGSFSGTLEHVEVVTMAGGSGGEDARLEFAGELFDNRIYLSEKDLVALEVNDLAVSFTTCDVIVRLTRL